MWVRTLVRYYILLSSQRQPIYPKRGCEAKCAFGPEFRAQSLQPPELFLELPLEQATAPAAWGILIPKQGLNLGAGNESTKS